MTLAAPVIGVTSFVEAVRWGRWSSLAALTPFRYVRAVATLVDEARRHCEAQAR